MPIGNAVPCPSCGQKFFPSSMKFHLKQCERKQAAMIVECPACGTSMPQAEIPAHMEKCPVARQQQRRLQERDATARGRRTGPARGPDGAGAAPRKAAAPPPVLSAPGADGRVPCAVCGRRFAPDRIAKHQFICGNVRDDSRKMVYDSRAARLRGIADSNADGGFGAPPPRGARRAATRSVFKPAEVVARRRAGGEPAARAAPSKWRSEHRAFIAMVREAKRQAGGGGVA